MAGARRVITAWAVVLGTVVLSAQLNFADRTVVEAYRTAIKRAESSNQLREIEAAFKAITQLRDMLMAKRNGKTVLESLPEADFQVLAQSLPGTAIGRNEILFVEPEVDYFMKLATAHGESVDRTFFSALRATRPGSIWPVFVEPQTDYSGCVRFGSMMLVDAYRAWSEFPRQFPGRYSDGAKRELDAVVKELTSSTCVCGDAASVELELKRFVADFPPSPVRTQVDQRLRAVQEGRSNLRFKCVSG
jgi:hypothetical protein